MKEMTEAEATDDAWVPLCVTGTVTGAEEPIGTRRKNKQRGGKKHKRKYAAKPDEKNNKDTKDKPKVNTTEATADVEMQEAP